MGLRRATLPVAYALALLASCTFDVSTRWVAPEPKPAKPPLCTVGQRRCTQSLEECQQGADGALAWVVIDACEKQDKVCASGLLKCVPCMPSETYCKGQEIHKCQDDGMASQLLGKCDTTVGQACRSGGCPQLCNVAAKEKSNVGCEYWAVDLDNAMIDQSKNAQAQQFAVVVSNPQPDVAVTVKIWQDDGKPGDAAAPKIVTQALIPPLNLRVFKLGPREVDGSPEGKYNKGTHTALSRHAYKVTSDFPVVAYQFNPLENANVFSNDASLLKPREALSYGFTGLVLSYVVAGWPQTIAWTDDPNTNFDPSDPTNLRVFLTIVGTEPKTHVVVEPTTAVLGGGPIPSVAKGAKLELDIDAFDVINLETPSFNSFNADFTGTRIYANKPIAVFSGSEASDVPRFKSLIERRCCADHLEEQLDPVRTAGKKFALAHEPSRTRAVKQAGGDLLVAPEPDYYRFIATVDAHTKIKTTLEPPYDNINLYKIGEWYEVESTRDFVAESDQPIHVAQLMPSQDAANVPRGLPGGDPSLIVVPPVEQFRADYVFLTPDKYAFDFITVVAPNGANVSLDGQMLSSQLCLVTPTDGLKPEKRGGKQPEFITYSCQLSFPTVDPTNGTVSPGMQHDGVHRINASQPVGVIVWGFDSYVSYAYAAGTDLREIAIPQ
jgi:hypothetical protein